jgi:hypothetical protein
MRGYDSTLDDRQEGCLVQLLGYAFLDEHEILCVILSSHLLPGGQGRSSMMSGLYLLPSILSQLLFAVISGAVGTYSSTPPRPAISIVLHTSQQIQTHI